MISIPGNSMNQTLNQYLLQYRSVFKKRSYLLFTWLITSILCTEEVRSIKFLYDTFIKKYCNKALNCFYYFLSYANFSCELLLQTTVKISLSIIPEELKPFATIFLTTDDTLQAKFGQKFDCYFHLFDHTNKNGSSYLDGHCFVSLVINIPLFWKGCIKYLSIPVGYRLYDKQQSKLEIVATLVKTVMPLLLDYQVILLCDSWYPKGAVIDAVKQYSNLDLIAATRSDTALYDLPPLPTGKKGRPRKYGDQIDIKSLQYEKIGNYYVSTKQVLTNLFETKPVQVTVTVKDIETFDSVKVFISTVKGENIKIFKEHKVEEIDYEPQMIQYLPYFTYSLRWNIEVIFYEHKFFWSFGNYMVRSQQAIERYVNLLAIAFAFVQMLPFIAPRCCDYKFQSPQTVKRAIAEQLTQELIFDTFVKRLENNKIYSVVKNAVDGFLGLDRTA
jgi:hypothetical protein